MCLEAECALVTSMGTYTGQVKYTCTCMYMYMYSSFQGVHCTKNSPSAQFHCTKNSNAYMLLRGRLVLNIATHCTKNSNVYMKLDTCIQWVC